ncbi:MULTISPECIES: AraC family transcriptional regulator [Sorangium]|uniref:AraC family transcriptional regulator n=1 Tax=Sorangium atrum TaxID=2995308 RepID=A0ABT5C8P8_9BACT|nr:AraC family transcriptional regulator [Sorangium aterium]MDC0682737.1 AraC family transcriptional regulator [Sorangium aterium]
MSTDVLTEWCRVLSTKGVLLARSRLPAPWGMRLEARAQVTFHIVTEGACWLRREGAAPLALHQGDLCLLPQGLAHELVHARDGRAEPLERLLERRSILPTGGPVTTMVCGAYCLDAQLAEPMLRGLPPVVHFAAKEVRANPPLSAVMSLVTAELDRPGPGSEVLVQHLFDALFLYILRAWADGVAASAPGWLPALKDAALSRALASMHADPAAPWTVETLAREAGLSRAAFARRFTAELGEPPLGYLTRWRMGLASRILLQSEASLAEVARRVGYESEFAFSRAFKRSRGVAPASFRRSRAEAPGLGGAP